MLPQFGVLTAFFVEIRGPLRDIGDIKCRQKDGSFAHGMDSFTHFSTSSGSGVASQIWMGLMAAPGPDCENAATRRLPSGEKEMRRDPPLAIERQQSPAGLQTPERQLALESPEADGRLFPRRGDCRRD